MKGNKYIEAAVPLLVTPVSEGLKWRASHLRGCTNPRRMYRQPTFHYRQKAINVNGITPYSMLSAQAGGGAGAELGLLGAEKAGFGPVGQFAMSLGTAILGGVGGNAAAGMASRAGQLFSAKEFTDSAARILGFNAEGGLTGAIGARVRTLSEKLAGIAEQTGPHPKTVAKDVQANPECFPPRSP